MSESYCSSELRLRWTLVPREGEGDLSPGSRVFVYLGRRRVGGVRWLGKGLGTLFSASPLREARPYLFPPSPSPHCTCILKAPCSPGIGPGRVLRRRNLNRQGEEGVLKAQWVDCTISAASPS